MSLTVVFHGIGESATESGLNLVISALSLEQDVKIIFMPGAFSLLDEQNHTINNALSEKLALMNDFPTCQILTYIPDNTNINMSFAPRIQIINMQQFRMICARQHCFYF